MKFFKQYESFKKEARKIKRLEKRKQKLSQNEYNEFFVEYNKLCTIIGKAIDNNYATDELKNKSIDELNTILSKYNPEYPFEFIPKNKLKDNRLFAVIGHDFFINNISDTTEDIPVETNDTTDDDTKDNNTKDAISIPEFILKIKDDIINTKKAKILKFGSKNEYVKLIQSLLGIDVDGIFGNDTKNAIMKFQKDNNLTIDGIVGKETWGKLLKSDIIVQTDNIIKKIDDIKTNVKTNVKEKTKDIQKTITDINTIKSIFEHIINESLSDDILKDITLDILSNTTLIVKYKNDIVDDLTYKQVDGKIVIDDADKKEIISKIQNKQNTTTNIKSTDSMIIDTDGNEIDYKIFYKGIKESNNNIFTYNGKKLSLNNVMYFISLNKTKPTIIKMLRDLYNEKIGYESPKPIGMSKVSNNSRLEIYFIKNQTIIKTDKQRMSLTEILMKSIKDSEMVANLIYVAIHGIGTFDEILKVVEFNLNKTKDTKYIKSISDKYLAIYGESVITDIESEFKGDTKFYSLIQLFKNI